MLSKNKILIPAALLLYSASVPLYALPTQSGLWFAISGYAFWPNQPNTTLIYMGGTNPPIPDYYFHASTNESGSFNGSAGYEFDWFYSYAVTYRLGLLYQNTFNSNTDGKIKNSDQIDYTYKYEVNSRALFFDGQVDLFPCQWLGPYIDIGLGAARNEIKNYQEHTIPHHIARVSPDFAKHTQYSFAYRLGVGINYRFEVSSENLQASIAYIFVNDGTAITGNSKYYKDIAGQHLEQRISGNQLEVTLRYYIE